MKTYITEKWEKTGLLNELDESKVDACAKYLERTAQFLIEDYDNHGYNEAKDRKSVKNDIDQLYDEDGGWFAGISLPVARRIYGEIDSPPNPKWLYYDLKLFLTSKHQLFKDIKECSIAGDTEPEMCELYVKDLVARLS